MATKYLLDLSLTNGYLSESSFSFSYAKGIEHCFKVQGESRVVAIFSSSTGADKIANEMQCTFSDSTLTTKCTPIIPYEGFAKASLGVSDSEVERRGATPAFNPEREIYWLQVDVGYEGHTLEELRQAWHDEAVAALGLVHGGQVPVALYKSVFMKQVHLFIQMDGAALDQLNLQLPLFKALGDQVKTTTKRIKAF